MEQTSRKDRHLLSLSLGIAGSGILALFIVFLGQEFQPKITIQLLLDSILLTSMISVAISLFAFSRYVVLRERLLEFIAFAFLIGGFIRIAGFTVSDLGIFWAGQQASSFQLAAWQGGRFLLGLMLAVGTLLVWIFPKSKSAFLDVLVAIVIASVFVFVFVFISNKYSLGGQISLGNSRSLIFITTALFLISFVGVSRNYLKIPTLFNYSISLTLFLMTFAGVVNFFSNSVTDVASTTEIGLTALAYTIGAIGSLIDVGQIFNEYVRNSERLKAANQELQKYEIYIEKVPDPIVITDDAGLPLYLNPAFKENFGYSLSEIREKGLHHVYDPADREKAQRHDQLVSEGKGDELELEVIRSDEQKIDALLNSAPIIIDGRRLGTITAFRDITRRNQLEHRDKVLSAAVENTDEAIALTDPGGRVTFMNSAAERLFGYALKELPRGSLWALVSPSFGTTSAREIYVQTVRNGSWKGEVLNRKKDGTEYYIALNTSSIKDSVGKIIALVGICEDITDKKWGERRKEAVYRISQFAISSRRLSELAQLTVDLLSEVLNSPLVVMYSYDEKNATLELMAERNVLGKNLSLPILQRLGIGKENDAARAVKTRHTTFSRSILETEFAGLGNSIPEAEGLLSIPLISSGDLLGTIQYMTFATAGNLTYEASLAEVATSELAVGMQRLKLASRIAEQADQLEKIFASAAEGIILVNRLGKILLMNEGGKNILGIRDIPEIAFGQYAQALGMHWLDGSPLPDDVNPIKSAALDGKNVRNFEFIIVRSGVVRVLSISASPLIDSAGSLSGAVAIFSDITEQKENDIAIKKQNERLSVINGTALAVKDALDVSEILNKSLPRLLEFEDVSAVAVYLKQEDAADLELAAALGFSPEFEKTAFVPDSRKGIFAEIMNGGEAEVFPDTQKAFDRSEFFRILSKERVTCAVFTPIIGTRKPYGVLVSVCRKKTDPTQADKGFFMTVSRVIGAAVENAFLYSDLLEKSRELEDSNEQLRMSKIWVEEANAQLIQGNQKLEEASRLKSQFLANMSHELRTPLNSIIGFTNLILTDDLQPPTGDQKEGLDIVLRNAKNLLALINDILDLSKIEAGRMTISLEEFTIDTIVSDSIATVEPLIGDKPVKLFSEIDTAVPTMHTDPARIKQIVLNLLSNASKFTDDGHIKIAVKRLDDNFISVAVEDTGTGIPPEFLEVVFEEFRQVDGTNTRKHGGTGLGLAISRRLARMLGGDLTVKSEVGKGSTFMLTVPVNYRPTEKTEMERQTVSPLIGIPSGSEVNSEQARNLVVCIDDDPEVLLLLKNHLVSEGFGFLGVTESQNAVEVVRKHRPVLVTLDIVMPHKDGWQILQELKSDPDLKEIPVVIHTVVDNKALAVSLGAESYLVKPVQAETIISVIRMHTGTDGGEILVVDDNEDFTDFLRNLLEKSRFTIYTAKNGIEAIDQLHKIIPRLVFLDLLMPEMDGFEVVEKMYEDEKLKEVPVVVLTAKEVTEDDRARLNLKIKDVVQKEGLTREIILREVNKFIRKKKGQS